MSWRTAHYDATAKLFCKVVPNFFASASATVRLILTKATWTIGTASSARWTIVTCLCAGVCRYNTQLARAGHTCHQL